MRFSARLEEEDIWFELLFVTPLFLRCDVFALLLLLLFILDYCFCCDCCYGYGYGCY